MAFKNGAYATVWGVEHFSDTMTKVNLSTSRKDKQTGQYETDFSGFVAFVGATNATKATVLKERDRIKLGDVEVSTKYDKERNKTYTNFTVFSFEMADGSQAAAPAEVHGANNGFMDASVDSGEADTVEFPF